MRDGSRTSSVWPCADGPTHEPMGLGPCAVRFTADSHPGRRRLPGRKACLPYHVMSPCPGLRRPRGGPATRRLRIEGLFQRIGHDVHQPRWPSRPHRLQQLPAAARCRPSPGPGCRPRPAWSCRQQPAGRLGPSRLGPCRLGPCRQPASQRATGLAGVSEPAAPGRPSWLGQQRLRAMPPAARRDRRPPTGHAPRHHRPEVPGGPAGVRLSPAQPQHDDLDGSLGTWPLHPKARCSSMAL